jgi:hypothetical protein
MGAQIAPAAAVDQGALIKAAGCGWIRRATLSAFGTLQKQTGRWRNANGRNF